MRFVLTIDAEADDQWSHGRPLKMDNVAHWQRLQDLCASKGVLPTYLITSEIATDRSACAMLSAWTDAGEAEVGAHLHPWTTAPFVDCPGLRYNDRYHAYPSELPPQLLADKLFTLTNQVEQSVGRAPTAFRAGRFGFSRPCAEHLRALGYVVDSSVTPLTNWRGSAGLPDGGGGPDFRDFTVFPFLIRHSGEPALLEIPVTIWTTAPLLRYSAALRRLAGSSLVKRAAALGRDEPPPPQPVWLRPSPRFTLNALIRLWETCEAMGSPVGVMMFHSSELMPGGSPYWPTSESVTGLFDILKNFFDFLIRRRVSCTTLTAAAHNILSSSPGPEEQTL